MTDKTKHLTDISTWSAQDFRDAADAVEAYGTGKLEWQRVRTSHAYRAAATAQASK